MQATNLFLSHINLEPILYGLLIIGGLATIWYKIVRGHVGNALVEITIFIIVFKLHGGTLSGGMAATVAALVGGFLFPIITHFASYRRKRGR